MSITEREKEVKYIIDFVKQYRAKFNVEPTPGIKQELSGEAYGEAYLLLFRQLVNTIEGHGSWRELDDDLVRKLVLDEIEKALEKGIFRKS